MISLFLRNNISDPTKFCFYCVILIENISFRFCHRALFSETNRCINICSHPKNFLDNNKTKYDLLQKTLKPKMN